MVAIALLALILASLLFLYFILVYRQRKISFSIPCPPRVPFLGHALRFKTHSDTFRVFMEYLKDYGGVFQLQIGPTDPFLVFASPESIEFVLASTKHLDKSLDYKFFHKWLGTGLLTSNGSKWKKHRRIITPTFHFKVLEEFVDVFNSTGDVLIKKLKNQVGKGSFNIVPFFSLFTLDAICETSMGININAQKHPSSEYVRSVKEMCRIVMSRVISIIKHNDFLYRFTSDYRKEQNALECLHDFSNTVIKKKKKELLRSNHKNNESSINEFGIKEKKVFLDLLIEFSQKEKDPLTDLELREEVDTFVFEGHDTTSSALSFASYCLAENVQVQKLAYEEQVAIFGSDIERNATYKDLQNMPYLELVLKETLRMYPSVPIYSRMFSSDVVFEGTVIPKGTEVMIFAYGVHHNSKVYPDPEKFDPERFAGVSNRSPYAYIPFSAGSRNCIGQKFAMLEMKATLSKLLRYFEIIPVTPKHDLELDFETVLVSKNGVCVAVKPR